ncbi:hypothetical protein B0H13DRAFT_1880853 [Mycena leptocephala]|nr:hypothetical protein B0H13DRAFT_1880853 [Mycena leptocephala]
MQSPVHSERFDSDWNRMIGSFWAMGASFLLYGIFISLFLLTIYTLSRRKKTSAIKFLIVMSCVMAVLGTTQMAVTIAAAIVEGRLVQQVVHGQVLNQRDPKLTRQMLAMVQNVLYAMNKSAWIELACSYLVLWVLWSTSTGVSDVRIMFVLGVATNAVLTTLTGKLIFSIIGLQWLKASLSWSDNVDPTCSIACWSRSHTWEPLRHGHWSHVSRLDSGAIYCIAGLILVISLSLGGLQLCIIVLGVGPQLLNIIPTFTLVYVGLANPVDDRPVVTHQIPSKHAAFRSAAVQQPIQPRQVMETCRLPVIENIGKTLNITFKQHSTAPIAFRWSYL